ncbi:MAG TPA: SDR family NAD(P)-dependent oxidoreductase, partial [Mycobacterium sp.]|nr:SDR family NAD(P)-dependent oxidoreductase [Mycobacterium sp.]
MARWLITGCSTGIGREIARAALEAGHSVVVTARRTETVADFQCGTGDFASDTGRTSGDEPAGHVRSSLREAG